MQGALGFGLEKISKIKDFEADRGKHVLDFTVQVKDPYRIDMMVGILQQLQSVKSDLAVGIFAASRNNKSKKSVNQKLGLGDDEMKWVG